MGLVLRVVVLIPFLVTALVAIGVLFIVLKRKKAEADLKKNIIEGEFLDEEDSFADEQHALEGEFATEESDAEGK